ncbi:hypothetical protein F4823DRAFT_578658 [Ustulina deusta]|nr:hypothetical protein F4823DRAFT_578658 [Ustulina deusta]
MAKSRKNFYGVRAGRIPGVYDNWDDCKAQVDKYRGCVYRGFESKDEATFYVATGQVCDGENGEALFAEWKRTKRAKIAANNVKKEKTPQIKAEAFDSSQSYFSQLPNFEPDADADFDDEFGRFASSQNIAPGSKAWRQKRTDVIRHEMVFHYSQKVDSDDEDDIKDDIKEEDKDHLGLSGEEEERRRKLQILQNMCREAKIEPLDTIDGCVANLKGELINIVDYVNARRNGMPIKVWPPDKFEEFREYTLSDKHRMDLETAMSGDGLLAALLQVLRSRNAAGVYQHRRHRAVIAREGCASRVSDNITDEKIQRRLSIVKEEPSTPCEVISIHGTDSDCSPSPGPIKEADDIPPWSPSSIGSSVVEILINSQAGTKRDLHDFMEEQDISEDGVVSTSLHKRPRM